MPWLCPLVGIVILGRLDGRRLANIVIAIDLVSESGERAYRPLLGCRNDTADAVCGVTGRVAVAGDCDCAEQFQYFSRSDRW